MVVRVLQVVNGMDRAGLETMLMNYYRNIDKSKIQFDFLTHRSNVFDYEEEIKSLGGKIYRMPRLYPQNYRKYLKEMSKFFNDHSEYKIIHSHIDSMSYLPLLAAKRAGVPIRIAHSHNTAIDFDLKFPLKELFRYKLINVANFFCACGQDAGEYLFRGKRTFTYIPNAINKDKFTFNLNIRKEMREKLNLQHKFVVGNVGRLEKQKNQVFLIRMFNELVKIQKNSMLIIIGVGSKRKQLEKVVRKLGLKSRVMFLGKRTDVDKLYQAMDVFVMPSIYEGIPVAGVEAQFAGLPCFFSSRIPREVLFSANSCFLSLKDDEKKWAIQISKCYKKGKYRGDPLLTNNDFDISKTFINLQNYYLDLSKKAKG